MSEPTATRTTRVLIVEDDLEVRAALEELLKMEAFETVGASDGAEAIETLRKGTLPDLILLDLMMPGMDGWEFRIQQRRDPAWARIPVVAMSADPSAKAAAIDADAYVRKPYSFPELLVAIQRVLRMAHTRRVTHADRMASLGTLAAGIAHEINNPLSFVIANLQYLDERLPGKDAGPPADPEELRVVIREALQGAERIRRIVRDVKTFSHADEERRVPVELAEVIDTCLGVVASELRHRAQVVRHFQQAPAVLATHAWLSQVFVHLLLNAAHAIPEGNVAGNEVRVDVRSDKQGRAVVEIVDTGDGIPPEVRDRVFDPFFTTKPVGTGSGLGLSIVHGIVTALGGQISLQSELGRGTSVRVTLPGVPGAPTRVRPLTPEPMPAMPGKAEGRRRLLVIEDEPTLARAFQRMLRATHDVTITLSGREALARLQGGERFDAILCDLLMPEMTGMDFHAEIRKTLPGLEKRIIFMTGGAFTPRAREFLNEVTNPYLSKPFDLRRVSEALEQLGAE